MPLTEEDKFAAAERLWASGNPEKAVAIHVDLLRHADGPELRLRSALALVERLIPGWNVESILEACSTGIAMTEKLGDSATRAYLMGMRAKNLAMWNGSLTLERRNLRLAPDWLGFSLERDEEQYKSLTGRIEENDQEIDQLTREAQVSASDPTTRGHLLLSLGNIYLQRYLCRKSDSLQKSVRLPVLVRERLRSYALDEYFWYSASDRQVMHNYLKECEFTYSCAVTAFRAAGDELNVAHTLYAMANDLRTANRFRKAKRYLKQAETIARRSNDHQLLHLIPVLKERIRQRNRNVPNYAAGESDRKP